jgi:Family of unknown function (DUF6067)
MLLLGVFSTAGGEVAVVFTEAREFPIRRGQGLLADSLAQRQAAAQVIGHAARPGEFFVFQLGVYALKDTGPLSVTFADLAGGTETIPASALRCLSLSGTNYLGQPFAKEMAVKHGQLQALWIGVAVPKTAKGVYTGTAQVGVAPGKTIPVSISLRVDGSPVADGGDSVAKNLSRLRWLDSTVGSEATLTKPFTAVQTTGRVITVLGRELELGEDGLPARITSHFSSANTRIEKSSREVLARPATFVVETSTGPVSWQSKFGDLKGTDLEATWTARSTADGLRTDLKALGLDPARAVLYAPPIAGMQTEMQWKPGELIPVAPKRGWFLVLDEVRRQVAPATPAPDSVQKK